LAPIEPAIHSGIEPTIHPAIGVTRIDPTVWKYDVAIRIGRGIIARIDGRCGGGRLATAGRDRSGQQEGSKESHWLGGRSNLRSGSWEA
jgi:hypothetical protein